MFFALINTLIDDQNIMPALIPFSSLKKGSTEQNRTHYKPYFRMVIRQMFFSERIISELLNHIIFILYLLDLSKSLCICFPYCCVRKWPVLKADLTFLTPKTETKSYRHKVAQQVRRDVLSL